MALGKTEAYMGKCRIIPEYHTEFVIFAAQEKIMQKEIIKKSWKYLLFLFLISGPIFQHLGSLAIVTWDEARLANNAYEMYQNGNYLVTFYDGEPDMWNTKPPLMIWLQVFFMKLFGANEISVRLPSALAVFFTCIVLLYFSVRYLKSFWFGFICALILVTSSGYMDLHAARTGDYDALLSLFVTLSCFSFFIFIETLKNKYNYLFFFFLLLGFLTKSAAVLMILPGLFIYTIIRKKFLYILKNKHFYIALSGFLLLGGGYFFLREIYNPGYIAAVLENDFGGRFLRGAEMHAHGFSFYYDNFVRERWKEWIFLIPCGILVGIFIKDERMRKISLFSMIVIITFFMIISLSYTKLSWYDVPLYPFLSIIVTMFIHFVASFLKNDERISLYLKYNVVPCIFIFLIFLGPYKHILNKTYETEKSISTWDYYRTSYYLRDIIKEKRQGDNLTILYNEYPGHYVAHVKFYIDILNDAGKNILLKERECIENGEIILTSQGESKAYIEETFHNRIVDEYHNITVYEILGEKQKLSLNF